jgi:tetratricopeptide (TPR) repeat protein
MRPVLWGLLVFVVSLPLVFVLFLVIAARYPAMDSFTMSLPSGIRATVAELTMRNAGFDKNAAQRIDRTIRLDPESSDAWSRRCQMNFGGEKYETAACSKAVSLEPTAWNYNKLGAAQESDKNYCAAEDSYTSAIRASSNSSLYLRNMARAALRCGHVGASIAGFEVAEGLDAKPADDPDDEEDVKKDLQTDREYLTVAYNRSNQPAKATAVCAKAHADWKTCGCELTDTAVTCSGGPASSMPKK